jgi:hypothetical protein
MGRRRRIADRRPSDRSFRRPLGFRRPLRLEPLEERRLLAITVTTNLDVVDPNDGVLSLREAIAEANTSPGAETIDFAPALWANGPATILLT